MDSKKLTPTQAKAIAEALLAPAQAQQQARRSQLDRRVATAQAWRQQVQQRARWWVPGLCLGVGLAAVLSWPLWAGAVIGGLCAALCGALLAWRHRRNTAS